MCHQWDMVYMVAIFSEPCDSLRPSALPSAFLCNRHGHTEFRLQGGALTCQAAGSCQSANTAALVVCAHSQGYQKGTT